MIRGKTKIFIVGNSRSGTTMMSRILGNHPEVFTFHELHFFEQLWSPGDRNRIVNDHEAVSLMAHLLCIHRDGYLNQGNRHRFEGEAREIVDGIWEERLTPAQIYSGFLHYETAQHGKCVPCEQTPRNVLYIPEILALFPEGRIINMVRDPRDILLSQKKKWKRKYLGGRNIPFRESFRSWTNYHPITISQLWNASIRAALDFAGDGRIYFVRFEDLLSHPQETVRSVCSFLDLSFDPDMLEVPQVGSSSSPDKPDRKGINPERADGWQKGGLSVTEIFWCQKITARGMRRYGYPAVRCWPNAWIAIYNMISLPVQISLAFLLNLSRIRNIKETLRRRLGRPHAV